MNAIDYDTWKLTDDRKELPMKTIAEFEFIDHGVDNEQYFQGCGVCLTAFEDVATGCGDNPSAAVEDAIDQLAEQGWDTDGLEARVASELNVATIPQTPSLLKQWEQTGEVNEDCHYYVSIRVK